MPQQLIESATGLRAGRTRQASGRTVTPIPLEAGDLFVAYVAHELRTPLATQRALLELALADSSADVASWRECAKDVLAVCLQQERLLEACLTLARSRDELQPCDLVDLAAIAAEALRAHHLRDLECLVALEPAWTNGDPDLLGRLAANLVSNAIRHNIVGGRIEVATSVESGRRVLAVANTGPLVPATEVERLFQPFQRLDSNPRSFSDGVGLGLSIVQAIADAHDATIAARARADGGLEVSVSFAAPRKSAEPHRAGTAH
jgi:signal transduction histidine kinase